MRVYINPIALGILVSLLIIYLLFIPLFVHQFRRHGTLKIRRNIVIASFIIYMITAWFLTILPLPSMQAVREMKQIIPNYRPFLFITTFLNESGFILTKPKTWYSAILSPSCFTVVFNVFLTIPFGVYLKKYFKLPLAAVAILGFLLSLFYEVTQYTGLYGIYPKAYRLADVDDLIVNTFGAVVGYLLTRFIDHILPNIEKDKRVIKKEASFL
ncbi:VanZ family protein [Ruminiclostridium josui]|uniref:VanZ family protein n=1 Tax=Ruminiclostridium josui TaxID=1499 RepID=UPI0006D2C068|nr:VanZ family protein [Ruminiclostridium josui]